MALRICKRSDDGKNKYITIDVRELNGCASNSTNVFSILEEGETNIQCVDTVPRSILWHNEDYEKPPAPIDFKPVKIPKAVIDKSNDPDYIFGECEQDLDKYFILLLADMSFVISLIYVSKGIVVNFTESYIVHNGRPEIPLVVMYCSRPPHMCKECLLSLLPHRVQQKCYSTIENYPQPFDVAFYELADKPPDYIETDEGKFVNLRTKRIERVKKPLYPCVVVKEKRKLTEAVDHRDWNIGKLIPPQDEVEEVLELARSNLTDEEYIYFIQRNFLATYDLKKRRQTLVDAFTRTGKRYLKSKGMLAPTFEKYKEFMQNVEFPRVKIAKGGISTRATRSQFNYVLSYAEHNGTLKDGRYHLECGNFAVYRGTVYNMGNGACNINPIPIIRNFESYTHFRYKLPKEATFTPINKHLYMTINGLYICADEEDNLEILKDEERWWISEDEISKHMHDSDENRIYKGHITYFNETDCMIRFMRNT
jgi:hypothetical protein